MRLLDFSLLDTLERFSINSNKIRSFQPHEAKKQTSGNFTRYHYTSANAMVSILKGQAQGFGSVRFTDARFMNDRSEHMYFIKCLFEFLDEHRKDYQYCQTIVNDLLLNKYSEKDYLSLRVSELDEIIVKDFLFTKSRNFIFCLSKANDSLHMWNYYIRNGNYQGYNIGINIKDFLKSFSSESDSKADPIRIYCGNVIYDKSSQEKEIKALCDAIELFGEKTRGLPDERKGSFPSNSELAMGYLWLYIQYCGLFYKDKSFSDENEYRIVIQFDEYVAGESISTYFDSKSENINCDFFERNGILVPYLSVPLAKMQLRVLLWHLF